MKEISRDGIYKVSHPGNSSFNPDNAYLLCGIIPPTKPHSFHSKEKVDQPNVTIKLAKTHRIGAVKIINRTGSCQERAEGLTLWASPDGKSWQQQWQAETVAAEWTIDLKNPIDAQYIKIGLPGKGTLHLNQVVVFGK